MIAPVHRLKKADIVWLGTHRCKHRHTYLEHYQCYLKDFPNANRIGFFDIEATNLQATFGIILCWCILDGQTGKIHEACITKEDLSTGKLDKRVVQECVSILDQFDVICTYYGTKFDLPYVRTRAIHLGIDFPFYGSIKHLDLYYTVRNKFRLHSNRLNVACEFLLGQTEKTKIDSERWIRALQGNKQALNYILDHCQKDVRDLKRIHDRVIDFRYPGLKSI